jgi:hypothetical protein
LAAAAQTRFAQTRAAFIRQSCKILGASNIRPQPPAQHQKSQGTKNTPKLKTTQ